MSIMSNAKRALAIAAAAATLLSMAACGSSNAASGKSDSSGAASSGKIEVVASINQWGSVAEDLGGSNVEVTNIMTKTNVEAHDYEPTSQDVAKFGTAKVAVVNGADYDPWATKAAQPTKATLVTAASIAVSGMIGWVGLVVPHLCRKLVGSNFRVLLPCSMLAGAAFLLLVDNLSRNLLATEIPIGILTAFTGAPFFLYLMLRKGGAR